MKNINNQSIRSLNFKIMVLLKLIYEFNLIYFLLRHTIGKFKYISWFYTFL
jgi:hypothetical protein